MSTLQKMLYQCHSNPQCGSKMTNFGHSAIPRRVLAQCVLCRFVAPLLDGTRPQILLLEKTKNWWWTFSQFTLPGDSYWSLTKFQSWHLKKIRSILLLSLPSWQFSPYSVFDCFSTGGRPAMMICEAEACLQIRYGSNSLTFAAGSIYRFICRGWEFGNCGILSRRAISSSSSHFSLFKDDYRYFDTHKSHNNPGKECYPKRNFSLSLHSIINPCPAFHHHDGYV